MNAMRYDIQKNNTKLELIMEKLGIEKPEYSRGGNGNNRGSFFQNNSGRDAGNSIPSNNEMRHSTMEDLESEVG